MNDAERAAAMDNGTYCFEHDAVEPTQEGDYRACGECWHVFRTEQELVDAHNAVLASLRLLTPPEWAVGPEWEGDPSPPVTSGDAVFCCPHCVHDF